MKTISNVLLIVSLAFALNAYGQTKGEITATKSLVLYYSQTGATKTVAANIKSLLGADIDSIVAEKPYLGSFEATIGRCQQEMKDGIMPKLKAMNVDVAKYDTIFLGYPIWFGTFARPMISYIKSANLKGKVIIPFCTFGSGGLVETTAELKKEQPEATVLNGYGVRNARVDAIPQELNRFLKENHYLAGDIEALPNYSEQKPVTENEKQIFSQACSDYQFPLGTPKTVGKRKTSNGTDYVYKAEASYSKDGVPSVFTIYVTHIDGQKPVFTRVDR